MLAHRMAAKPDARQCAWQLTLSLLMRIANDVQIVRQTVPFAVNRNLVAPACFAIYAPGKSLQRQARLHNMQLHQCERCTLLTVILPC